MRIILDTNNPKDNEILAKLFDFNFATVSAQPEVAGNTGTVGSGFNTFPQADSGVSESEAEQPAPVAPEKPKRVRKPKAETAETAETVAVETAVHEDGVTTTGVAPLPEKSPEEQEAKPLTIDDVRAALQMYTASKGVPAGMELLKKFGAGRISELTADKYDAFKAECAL